MSAVMSSVCDNPKWTIYGGSEEGFGWSGRIRCVSLENVQYHELLKKNELFLNLKIVNFDMNKILKSIVD